MTDYTPMHAHDINDNDVLGDLNPNDNITPGTVATPIDEATSKKNMPAVAAAPVASVIVDGFDYKDVSPEVAEAARAAARRIRTMRRALRKGHIVIGRELLAIKAKLKHGQFGPWLHAEFHMSERSAQNYMSAADFVSRNATAAVLPPATIYLLAAPGTPEKVVLEVVAAIAAKKVPSTDDVRLLIKKEKRALAAESKAATAARRAEREAPEDAERLHKPAQREQTKRQKKADEEAAKESAARKAADDAVQLLVGRLTKAQLLTFCQLLRLADNWFKASLDKAVIVTVHESTAA